MNKRTNNKSKSTNNLVQIEKPGESNQENTGELIERLEDLNIISSLNNAMNEGKKLKEIIQLFSKKTKKLFSSLGATVYLLSEDSKYLIMQNSTLPRGIVKKVENIIRIKIPEVKISLDKESTYSRALGQMEPQIINNPEDIQKLIYDFAETVKLKNKILHKTFKKVTPKIYKLLKINSVLIVPLISSGKVIGVIDISRENPFRSSDLERFKSISGIITTAINKKIAEDRLKSFTLESNMILETGIDGMRVIDKDFNVLRVNNQFCKISGLSESKNLAKKCYESFPGEHCNKPTCPVKKIQSGSSYLERESKKVRTDGKVVPCIITIFPLMNADGKVTGMVENYKDITDRKKSEDALKKSEANFKETQKVANIGHWELNLSSNRFMWSDEIYQIFEISPKKSGVSYETFLDLIHPGDRDYVDKSYINSLGKKKPYSIVHRLFFKGGRVKYIQERYKTYYDGNGKPLRSIGTIQDITRKKKAEEEINNLAKFPSENPNPVLRVDYEGKIIYQNKACKNKLQNLKDKGGKYISKQITDLINNMIREKSEKQIAVDISSGKSVYEFSIKPIIKEGYTNIYGRDITERKKAQEDLEKSYINLQKTLNDVINTLASIIETKDPYTSGHQKRVAALSISISEEMGLDKDRIEAIGTAAMIHDIGKINIPASILARPGKISDIEYDMIKTHSQVGYNIVRRIEFPFPIADIILQHHERLDGSGYPEGLKGNDIVLEAKILAVADVVEAMSSYRPYRPALGMDKAIREIKKGKGKLYDGEVVEACIKVITKKGFKF